ncbi:hypothetical protein IE53DRAFT_183423 [Violaceomyces palustris]|uniref:Uncharacterized protein n=1 Tax=Violaceomyces palustris TaxID=1673888 RepID=A0ACD0NS93_9BASI|nr:hypothetical protein IE53DRAFT_183423 [Violaceomyces palustris]
MKRKRSLGRDGVVGLRCCRQNGAQGGKAMAVGWSPLWSRCERKRSKPFSFSFILFLARGTSLLRLDERRERERERERESRSKYSCNGKEGRDWRAMERTQMKEGKRMKTKMRKEDKEKKEGKGQDECRQVRLESKRQGKEFVDRHRGGGGGRERREEGEGWQGAKKLSVVWCGVEWWC